MERGFKEVYQSWAISSSAIIRDLARVWASPPAVVSEPAMNFLGFVFLLKTGMRYM